MNETTSNDYYERATAVLPGGVNSPVRAFKSVGSTPLFMDRADGARIFDVDGNEYIDFCNSWGPLICGHRHPEIVSAIYEQMQKALTFGTPCLPEVELAEYVVARLMSQVPSIERIRFVNSGTEAVMSALRLARGYTGRSRVIKFDGCYHGHVDSLLVKAGSGLATAGTPDSEGVPPGFTKETIVLPLDDIDAVRAAFKKHAKHLAAVIIEPVPANNGLLLQEPAYLKELAEICKKNGTLLIFDEVISGFRLGFAGAAGHYGIVPDLVTYGKIIGGGMPVGAFAGRAEIFAMLAPEGPVYQAGTLSGNPIAMRAGLAQLRLLDDPLYERLESFGSRLAAGFNSSGFAWRMQQIGSIFWLYESEDGTPPRRADQINREAMSTYARLHRHLLESGLYLAPSGYEVGFLSAPMTDADTEKLLSALKEFFS